MITQQYFAKMHKLLGVQLPLGNKRLLETSFTNFKEAYINFMVRDLYSSSMRTGDTVALR